jgi:ribonuclease D
MTPDASIAVVDILKARHWIDPLARLLTDPNVAHVMYDAEPSIQILAECFGLYISNVLDVQIRPMALDAALADEGLEPVVVDWRIRPLTGELVMIAARSVWYLPQLAADAVGHIAEDALLRASQRFSVPASSKFVITDDYYQSVMDEIMNRFEMDDTDCQVLLELVKWRESVGAIEEEDPHFVASNACLRKIVEGKPRSLEELARVIGEDTTPHLESFQSDLLYIVRKYCDHDPPLSERLLAIRDPQ